MVIPTALHMLCTLKKETIVTIPPRLPNPTHDTILLDQPAEVPILMQATTLPPAQGAVVLTEDRVMVIPTDLILQILQATAVLTLHHNTEDLTADHTGRTAEEVRTAGQDHMVIHIPTVDLFMVDLPLTTVGHILRLDTACE